MSPILPWLCHLRPAVPPTLRVLVLADRGVWSPRLGKRIRDLGWHPGLRLQETVTFHPLGQERRPARRLVPGPGHAWVGRGVAFRAKQAQRLGTLIVVWGEGRATPWVVLTDLPPERVGLCWYGLRVWVELGFRALKGLGWQWQKSRRTDPTRVARHWLVLAVATLWVMATGTRVEDAEAQGKLPGRLQIAPSCLTGPRGPRGRQSSLFQLGREELETQLRQGYCWRRLWLLPDPWPDPPPQLVIGYHQEGSEMSTAHTCTSPCQPQRGRRYGELSTRNRITLSADKQ
ncbi:MAG: transposase [Chloroflexi bacterium]|nr:transposase [Chloroflexota bacterium]